MTHRTTERRAELLAAVAEASRTVLDEEGGVHATYSTPDFPRALVRLAAALDDLDAYCPECDDAGVVPVVRHAGTSTCDPALVDEVPCTCEASRVLAEQRRARAGGDDGDR